MAKKYWIQGAIKRKGALRRQLKTKAGKKIPAEVLRRLATAEIGEKVKVNGTKTVTSQLKKRAVLARTLRGLRKK